MLSLQPATLKSGQKVMPHVKTNKQSGEHEKFGKEQFLNRKMNYERCC